MALIRVSHSCHFSDSRPDYFLINFWLISGIFLFDLFSVATLSSSGFGLRPYVYGLFTVKFSSSISASISTRSVLWKLSLSRAASGDGEGKRELGPYASTAGGELLKRRRTAARNKKSKGKKTKTNLNPRPFVTINIVFCDEDGLSEREREIRSYQRR